MFENNFVRTLAALSPSAPAPSASLSSFLNVFVLEFFAAAGVLEPGRVASEVSDFAFRPDSEKTKPFEKYWASSPFLLLRRFVQDAMRILVTEAAVERSFAALSEIWTKKRNRMAEGMADSLLFVKGNAPKVIFFNDDTAKPRPAHHDELDKDLWLQWLKVGASHAQSKPARQTVTLTSEIVRGSIVEVEFEFTEPGKRNAKKELRWSEAQVLEIIEAPNRRSSRTFKVYWKEAGSVEIWDPSKDTKWRWVKRG